jgi:uncharacterized protein YqgQ
MNEFLHGLYKEKLFDKRWLAKQESIINHNKGRYIICGSSKTHTTNNTILSKKRRCLPTFGIIMINTLSHYVSHAIIQDTIYLKCRLSICN